MAAVVNSRGLATAYPLLMITMIICFTDLVTGDPRFCAEICSSTSYPQMCFQYLGDDVHQISTMKEIQKKFMELGQEKTEELADLYKSMQETSSSNFGNLREHLSAYRTCERAYKDSHDQYTAAIRLYNLRKYSKVKEKLNKVVSNAQKCVLQSTYEDETDYESKVATINVEMIHLDGHP